MNNNQLETDFKAYVKKMINIILMVISNPVGFYKGMQKEGGYLEPLIFIAFMGGLIGIINLVLTLFGLGFSGSLCFPE